MFNSVKWADIFELLCEHIYNNFRDSGKEILSVFVSTCNSVQTFSLMKDNKSDLTLLVTYEHLAAAMCIATSTFTPNIGKLVSNCMQQHHMSH